MIQLSDLSRLKGLVIAHINICSIRYKLFEVQRILVNGNIDILGISETNLDSSCLSDLYEISGYTFIHYDRMDHTVRQSGGGICILELD